MIEASQTRNPPMPQTRPSGSVTAPGSSSAPMRLVQDGCQWPSTVFPIQSFITDSSASSSSMVGQSAIRVSIIQRRSGPQLSINCPPSQVWKRL